MRNIMGKPKGFWEWLHSMCKCDLTLLVQIGYMILCWSHECMIHGEDIGFYMHNCITVDYQAVLGCREFPNRLV